jgi:hypothetical protein
MKNKIYVLQLVDDQVLIAYEKENLVCMAQEIKEQFENVGLTTNLSKTKTGT